MTTMIKQVVVAAVSAAALGTVATGCGWADLNPASSVTINADPNAGATKEVVANFPGAKNIKVVHAQDNPNVMEWDMPDGKFCTALASQTFKNSDTPGQLIAQPYCRDGI